MADSLRILAVLFVFLVGLPLLIVAFGWVSVHWCRAERARRQMKKYHRVSQASSVRHRIK